ncbi:MAG: SDR family oxidoreductase [Candidatus Desulfofervidus sp.]|nr:SDR family oxidoreductase [Candidatus Desulfofervidus sp.]
MNVIIAGATGDIGRAIAKNLALKHRLLLTYRDEEKKNSLAQDLPKTEDVTFVSIKNLWEDAERIQKKFGLFTPEVFINAIGAGFYAKVEDTTLEILDASYETNLKIPFFLTQMAYNIFLKQKKGYVIFINSISGLEGFPYGTAYSAMKFALRGLAEVMYKEGKRYGIKVTSIFPGIVKTKLIQKMPFCPKEKCLLSPQTIANTIVYILNLDPTVEIKEIILKNKELLWR